jgi:hypothetical protein
MAGRASDAWSTEARRRARQRQIRALAVTLAISGLLLGAFLLQQGGVGVLWRASGSDRPDRAVLVVGTSYTPGMVVQGSAPVVPGEKLFLVYADGARERLKVTWLRKPVRTGLYHRVIPTVHRAYPRRPIAVELMSGTRTVARQVLPPPG